MPPIPVYQAIVRHSELLVEACEHYQKRSFRNRFYLAGPQGRVMCSIPLMSGKNNAMPIRETRIAYDTPWSRTMLRLIKTNYASAPFFDFIYTELTQIFNRKWTFLWDLNLALYQFTFDQIQCDIVINQTDDYKTVFDSGIADHRGKYLPNNLEDTSYQPVTYPQIHERENGFISNLSVLDLMMCCGPESLMMLKEG